MKKKDNARTEAARLLGRLSARAATPEQRKDRASKGGQAAQAKLTKAERSRRAKLRWQRRRLRDSQEQIAAQAIAVRNRRKANKTLREQLGKATEMNHRQAKDIGGQVQKPAVKSLADMIAESTTLAMGQRTAALETMIREFLKQTGAKVEDCVLVYQAEREKMTWRIEHRPKGEGGET